MPNRLELNPIISIYEVALAHRSALDEEKICIFDLGDLNPCGSCKYAVPIEDQNEADDLNRYYACMKHRRVVDDMIIQCGCQVAQRASGCERIDTLQLSQTDSRTLCVEMLTSEQQTEEEKDLGPGSYKYCGRLSLRPRSKK
ncbi:hypothetical protein [Desulfovibrio desulfuricans]|uniref:hypothetical protein n=1 Tax=Desulfovibrio desulfuricans TaxID=876 RepID=UPI0035B4704C